MQRLPGWCLITLWCRFQRICVRLGLYHDSQITVMIVTGAKGGLRLPCGPVEPVFPESVPNNPPEWMSGWAPTSMWWDHWISHPAMNSPSQRAPTCLVSPLGRNQLTLQEGKRTCSLHSCPLSFEHCPPQGYVLTLGKDTLTMSSHSWQPHPNHPSLVNTRVCARPEYVWWTVMTQIIC